MIVIRRVDRTNSRRGRAEWTIRVLFDPDRLKLSSKCIDHKKPTVQRIADLQNVFNDLHRLQTSDNPAKRTDHSRLGAIGNRPRRRRFRKKTAVTRSFIRRIEERNLSFKTENTSVNQRFFRKKSTIAI